jgi:hypothetical protein
MKITKTQLRRIIREVAATWPADPRDELILNLKHKFGLRHVRKSEDFDPTRIGGLWMSAEGGEELGGDRLFDYYNTDDTYDFGVHSDLVDFLEQHGQVPEWYDPGTILTYPE